MKKRKSERIKKKENITLYKYVSSDYCMDTINNSRLHLFSSDSSNDPFELFDEENNYIDSHVMLSLTGGFQRKLMWSFYANSHKGVCLAVKMDKKLVSPIIYSSKRINTKIPYEEFIKTKCFFKKKENLFSPDHKNIYWYFVKDRKWKDEKEYRCIFKRNSIGVERQTIEKELHYFVKIKIKTIYLGAKISNKMEKDIIEIAKDNKIEVKKMNLSQKGYKMCVTSVWKPNKKKEK